MQKTFLVESVEAWTVPDGSMRYGRWVQIDGLWHGQWHRIESTGTVVLDGVKVIDVADASDPLG